MQNHSDDKKIAIQIRGVKKQYRLGQIGGGTLQGDLQSWWARVRGKEDPNTKIGQEERLVGQTFMALNGIDMTIYQGEAVGIIGSNGAGKSTLLKLLSRVTAPTAGEIDIYGRIVSMLEVGTGFNMEMTGRENVYMNGAILGMTKAEIDAKMEDIIDFSEVREFIDTPVKRYSSGMYVKLAFSVAAHLDSEIMIMDEVLAVGDMAFQKKCLDKMRDAAKKDGRTVLYVSHNMNTIRQLCDRCFVLDKGKVVFEGGVEEAIEVYSGTSCQFFTHNVYTRRHHSDFRSTNAFQITCLDILNKNENIFEFGEAIQADITIYSQKTWEQVRLRFEVKYQDGTNVGTALTDRGVDIDSESEQKIQMEIPTEHLAPGRYKVNVIAYANGILGSEIFLDGVYPGFSFEISDRFNEKHNITWLEKWWGHVQLHDAVVSVK